jgi:hypothetical protein
MTGNKEALAGYGNTLWQAMTPFGGEALFGPFRPEINAIGNYDPYFNKHIIPVTDEGSAVWIKDKEGNVLEGREGLDKYSFIPKNLSKGLFRATRLEWDPRIIDHVLQGHFTNVWKGIREAGNVAAGESSLPEILKNYIGLFQESPGYGSEIIQDVYDHARYYRDLRSSKIIRLGKKISRVSDSETESEKEEAKREMLRYARVLQQYYRSKDQNK